MPDAQTNTLRAKLLFCVDGLTLRDELAIKSLVRMLSHRTHHHWMYSPEKADLKVVGNAVDEMADERESAATVSQVLRVGLNKKQDGPFLSIPVHSNELELMLNDLGKRIRQSRQGELEAQTKPDSNVEFRLLKWPPAALLTGPGRTKVATLIMGRSMNLVALAQRSGIEMDACASYLRELHAGGFLAMRAGGAESPQGAAEGLAVASAPAKQKVASGLLSRIRSRLGLAA